MKRQYKILLPFLLAIVHTLFVSADTFKFNYDNSGNRISREIILSTRSMGNESDNFITYNDMIDEKTITIHPNPTRGQLKVEIPDYKTGEQCELSIFSIDGKIMMSTKPYDIITDLDISTYPNGIYILNIQIGESVSSWKIIKK